jgi:transposase
MGKCFREYQPEQALLLPPSLEDWLPEGHLARFISEVVGELDLGPIYHSYEDKDGRGQAAYEPLMMLKVLFYGYCIGIASSRRIEKATYENVAFRYLSANQHPDHDTLAEFRRRHRTALAGLFVQVLRLCQQAGLVKLGHVALDGTKIRANASRYRNRSYERLSAQEKELAEQVERILAEAERVDRAEDEQPGRGRRGDELPAEFAEREARLRKIREAKAELERQARQQAEEKKAKIQRRLRERQQKALERGRPLRGTLPALPDPETAVPKPTAVVNLTDPESRVMRKGGSSGFAQGFNAQAAVDGHRQIIVAAEVTNQQGDRTQLVPMLQQVEQNTGAKPEKVSADTGYYSPEQVWSPEVRGIDLYVKPDGGPKKYRPSPAARDPDRPPPRKPKWRLRCGYDSDGLPRIDPLRAKLASAPGQAIYQKRREIVEPVFGQIKQGRCFRQFLLRGLDQARAEWKLICLTHNLLKLHRAGWSPQKA